MVAAAVVALKLEVETVDFVPYSVYDFVEAFEENLVPTLVLH